MGEVKVSVDFSTNKYTDAELAVKANAIIEKMTDNPYYEEPDPELDVVQAAADAYAEALEKVDDGSKSDTVVKNNLRKELETKLKQLGSYVQWSSAGDEAKILTSGFEIHRKREAVGPLEKVHDVVVKAGVAKGSLELSWHVVPHAVIYEYEYAELPLQDSNGWARKSTTKHKVLIEGLNSGKQYAFRVTGAGADPSRLWSDEAISFVL